MYALLEWWVRDTEHFILRSDGTIAEEFEGAWRCAGTIPAGLDVLGYARLLSVLPGVRVRWALVPR
jgi:hypothetical protein